MYKSEKKNGGNEIFTFRKSYIENFRFNTNAFNFSYRLRNGYFGETFVTILYFNIQRLSSCLNTVVEINMHYKILLFNKDVQQPCDPCVNVTSE